jgi:hypothetical protein
MAALTARRGTTASVSIYFVALLFLGVCSWLGLEDLRVHRALALAQRQSDKLAATVRNHGNEVRQLQALVVDLSNSMHHNLTHLRAVTDKLQLHNIEREHARVGTQRGDSRNGTCANFSSSPCLWGGRQYTCMTVPGTLLHKQNAPSPLESCLGGHLSWGTCGRGQFLCRSDMERNITGCREPQFAVQFCAVSQTNKFIFIHVPKTGGSSINAFFRRALCSSSAANSTKCKETVLIIMQCAEAIAKYPSFFRFSFVRNPFARAISAFFMASRPEYMQDGKLLTFEEWAREPEKLNTRLYAMHWMPATNFLYTESRCRVSDFVGKQETLEADLRAALKRIGNKKILEHLDAHGIPHENKVAQPGLAVSKMIKSQYRKYVTN